MFIKLEENPKIILPDLFKNTNEYGFSVFRYSSRLLEESLNIHKMQSYLASMLEKYISSIDPDTKTLVIDKHYYPAEMGLFYEGYTIARFSFYEQKFINVREDYENPYNERIISFYRSIKELEEELKEYQEYVSEPKSVLKKIF